MTTMIIINKYIKFLILFLVLTNLLVYPNTSYPAGSADGDNNNQVNLYKVGKKLVQRAKKLEKKNKIEKAEKLYSKAYDKFEKAYAKDKKNADILNYLGFTTRKLGDFKKGEKYYLEGLAIEPGHIGINEYLGELYVATNRIDLAKERLEILKSCNCKEYQELKEIIDGTKKSKY